MVEKVLSCLSNLDEVYQKAENNYRTARINEVAALICHINSTLSKEKTGTSDENSSKFRLVPLPDLMSNRFLTDLDKIFRLEIAV